MRYYYPARIGSALSQGFDTFQQLDDSTDDHLESLLKTIMDLEQRQGKKCVADFITWRGMMTKVSKSITSIVRSFFSSVPRSWLAHSISIKAGTTRLHAWQQIP